MDLDGLVSLALVCWKVQGQVPSQRVYQSREWPSPRSPGIVCHSWRTGWFHRSLHPPTGDLHQRLCLQKHRTLRSGWHTRGRAVMDGGRLSHSGCSAGRGGKGSAVSTVKHLPPQHQYWAGLLHCRILNVSVGKLGAALGQRHWTLFPKHMESFPMCSFQGQGFLSSH